MVQNSAIGQDYFGDCASVTVSGMGAKCDCLLMRQFNSELFRLRGERLFLFGTVNPMKPDPFLYSFMEDYDGVPVCDRDNPRLKLFSLWYLRERVTGEREC